MVLKCVYILYKNINNLFCTVLLHETYFFISSDQSWGPQQATQNLSHSLLNALAHAGHRSQAFPSLVVKVLDSPKQRLCSFGNSHKELLDHPHTDETLTLLAFSPPYHRHINIYMSMLPTRWMTASNFMHQLFSPTSNSAPQLAPAASTYIMPHRLLGTIFPSSVPAAAVSPQLKNPHR